MRHSSQEKTDVTVEPQRRALDDMSQGLIAKLHAMIAEQEARTKSFENQSHTATNSPESASFSDFSSVALPTASDISREPSRESEQTQAPALRSPHLPPLPTTQLSAHTHPRSKKATISPASATRRNNREQQPDEGKKDISGKTVAICLVIVFILFKACS